jgi:hypothetical protein
LSLDEYKSVDAEVFARRAAEVFEKTKATSDVAAANIVLSRALLAQGKLVDAQQSIARATAALGQSHRRELEWIAAITAMRVKVASGKTEGSSEAARSLVAIESAANAAGFVNVVLEARLAIGEIEMSSGNSNAGRAHLEALQRDASNGGFPLMARKAAAALRTGRDQAALKMGSQ